MSHKIITIARQFGSGGHEVAQRLSDQLGIPLYDRNLVEMAAERMGHSPVSIEKADESALSSFLAGYQIPKEPNSVTGYGLSLNDSTYVTQTIIIEALAQKGPCVIVGRCADYALADYPNTVSVFICGDEEDKIRHLMERHNVDEAKAKDIMIKTDKRRASYYNYYSSKRWGSCKSYDMCISSSAVGYDGAVDIIKEFAKKKQEFLKTKNYK